MQFACKWQPCLVPDGQVVLGISGASVCTHKDSVCTSQRKSLHMSSKRERERERGKHTRARAMEPDRPDSNPASMTYYLLCPEARLLYLPDLHFLGIFANQRSNILSSGLLLG